MIRIGLVLMVAGSMSASAMAQAELFGVAFRDPAFSGNTRIYSVDATTGIASNGQVTGADVLLGLARGSDGMYYVLTDDFATPAPSALLTVDPATGATAVVGGTGVQYFEGDLDFNPTTGALWAVRTQNGASTLDQLDPANGGVLGSAALAGVADASAMAFDASGKLFVLDTTFAFPPGPAVLHEIDRLTGATISQVTTNLALGSTAGMDFDPITGALYVADGDLNGTNNLYTLDVASGQFTLVGDTGLGGPFGGLAGLEFVPEPSALVLLLLGGGLGLRRR